LEANKTKETAMSQFLYIYHNEGPSASRPKPSPEQMQATMQKWMNWMKALGEKGHLKDAGNPLEPTGKLVKGKQKSVTDGPYAESKDIIGGYSLVEARDIAEAVELSKGCPIFETDGSVEVRPIMNMSM
jgi:hypothetical protein